MTPSDTLEHQLLRSQQETALSFKLDTDNQLYNYQ